MCNVFDAMREYTKERCIAARKGTERCENLGVDSLPWDHGRLKHLECLLFPILSNVTIWYHMWPICGLQDGYNMFIVPILPPKCSKYIQIISNVSCIWPLASSGWVMPWKFMEIQDYRATVRKSSTNDTARKEEVLSDDEKWHCEKCKAGWFPVSWGPCQANPGSFTFSRCTLSNSAPPQKRENFCQRYVKNKPAETSRWTSKYCSTQRDYFSRRSVNHIIDHRTKAEIWFGIGYI